MLANPQAAATGREEIAAIALLAEMAAGVAVGDEAGGGEMQIVGGELVDQRPEGFGIGRRVVPAGEIAAFIVEGKSRREIEADQGAGVAGGKVGEPIEDVWARPVAVNQFGRGVAGVAARDREPLGPLDRLAGPVDRDECVEAYGLSS